MVALPDQSNYALWRSRFFTRAMATAAGLVPKGLYARALIIIIAPIVLLESVVAFVFMERHWEAVTRRLSESTAGDIASLADIYQSFPAKDDNRWLIDLARDRFKLSLQILPAADLPAARPKPFFDLLDRTLSDEIRKQIDKPFWIDTVGRSNHVEVRIRLDDAIVRVVARRNQTYASNSHIFLIWMVVTSLILLTVAILFLRNQIKPILRLAEAAEAFGKGQPVPDDFRPRGAREVRQAAQAFIEMRDRIEKALEQRTTMLAGVSHDLRTILTRFRLELAMLEESLEDNSEIDAMRSDINEMHLMLEDYMAFAKGGSGEEASPVDVMEMLEDIRDEVARAGKTVKLQVQKHRKQPVPLRRHSFKRAITNLANNAVRYADNVVIKLRQDRKWLQIVVEDDGPGIPEDQREEVFRPFHRLDNSRNQDTGNSGLGLAIARDIAHLHGGEIWLEESNMGGLKAIVRLPI